MRDADRRITILAHVRATGRCRYCKHRIVWVTSSPHGKMLPFDRAPHVYDEFENSHGVHFEIIAPDGLHFQTCPERPKRKSSPPWLRSQVSR